ncbi:helix-turn-helix transcriptional regulator [Salinimonas sp. HHU 13199]|uniref:Helix-turn-helix transcriptional regulator n=1 Tax=Salinimonas profundi TaxID=2729140 RepID=A0ABR8LLI0_9ALTE|nr:helix-turn-helix transcriptional regulator [Salinimonas profundi]MBD3587069.1 helix-turn-helix transcriptional regulator [Salinimonas profundi]
MLNHPTFSQQQTLCLSVLSKRELQVAQKILEGLPNKTIAARLFISERTVKFHCANIYRKLEIRNRAALMAQYFHQFYAMSNTLPKAS